MNLCENWPPPPLDPLEHNHAPGEEFQFRWKSISGGWRRLKWIGMGTDCEKLNAMVENAALATEHYNKARGFSFGSSDAMKSLASMWKALKAVDIPDPYMPPVCGLVNGVAALIELHAINRRRGRAQQAEQRHGRQIPWVERLLHPTVISTRRRQ